MGLDKQGSKPTGLTGRIIGRLMNTFHTSFYVDYFKNNLPADNSKILDIGCGGGKFLNYLYRSNNSYFLYGVDHSPEMIELAAKINKLAIEQNRLKLIQGSVSDIELDNSQLDVITAFETVQFWPETNRSFLEVHRLLTPRGHFIIINRYPPEGSKWWKMANIKNDTAYIRELEKAGFRQISIDLKYKNGWIIVKTTK